MAEALKVAYLAQGKLYITQLGKDPKLVESAFVQELLDRAERSRERNNWKDDGMAWNLRSGGFSPLGGATRPAEVRQIHFDSVARGHNAGEMFYSIISDHVGGIFHLEFDGNYERRLVHRNGLHACDLCLHPQQRTLAMSLRYDDGTANIGVMEVDRRGIRDLTEGDSIDEAPVWVHGKPQELIYQSAGISRDPHGFPQAIGPYSLHRLDVANSSHELVVSDDRQDYLLPRTAADGQLLYIRRPYQSVAPVPVLKTVEDALLFPFRAVRTIVHVLHVISMAVSGKPLITAGGVERRGPVPEQLMLWGRLVQANDSMRRAGTSDSAGLVPSDWRLVARRENGSEQVIADRVLAYDLASDGSILCTNGRRVWAIRPNGNTEDLCSGHLIQRLAAIS